MATMWPRRLRSEIRNNPLRGAECRVYDALEKSLDEGWTVFYSRPWLGLSKLGEEIDGEADFVVAHPDFGFLSIEVKGGRIDYDPRNESWTSTDRGGITHSIKDPFEQAKKSKHNIGKKLAQSPHWEPRFTTWRHGVIFPDASVPLRDYGPDRPRFLIADRSELTASIAEWVIGRFSRRSSDDQEREGSLGLDGIRALKKLLADPFHLSVPLGHLVDDDLKALEVLTERQFQILTAISRIRRLAVTGGAGTGKTVLAIEAARRDAEQGKRTLLTCFNRALATRLKSVASENLEILGFHQLCGNMAARAGVDIRETANGREMFDSLLPQALADAMSRRPELRYSTIIVDEGQDFRTEWWIALEECLAPGGRLVVFHDSNQRLYGATRKLPQDISAEQFVLVQNLRNTDPIHDATMRLYDGEAVQPSGVPGTPVQPIMAKDAESIRKNIGATLTRLIDHERVPAEQIAVLFADDAERQRFCPDDRIDGAPISDCEEQAEGAVVVDTIRRFKGLDSPAVIVVATPKCSATEDLAYVGLSRARAILVVIGDQASLSGMRLSAGDPR